MRAESGSCQNPRRLSFQTSSRTAKPAVSTFGLENMLSTRFWSAVKTGTSKDMRDNWTIGYSRKYTVGVWAGNFSGSSMWNVTGIHGAAPVWLEIMNYLHDRDTSERPAPPEGVVRREVKFRQSVRLCRSISWSAPMPGMKLSRWQKRSGLGSHTLRISLLWP